MTVTKGAYSSHAAGGGGRVVSPCCVSPLSPDMVQHNATRELSPACACLPVIDLGGFMAHGSVFNSVALPAPSKEEQGTKRLYER